MKTLTAIALALACVAASSPAIRAGVAVASEPGQWILAMSGALLPIGSPVTLITPDTPQQVHRAIVSARVPQSPVMTKHNIPGPYYSITAEDGAKALPELAIAVLGRPAITRVADEMSLRAGARYPGVRVRSCSSSEGLHLTLWSGLPLKSARLWHQYYYLGYDVEPTCRPEEYRDGG